MPAKSTSVTPGDTESEDAAILQRVVAGDDLAARGFYEQHFDFVWSIVSRYSESADEASDMLQDAFVRIFQTLGRFRGDASVRTWLFRVVTGCALDHVRRQRSRRRWTTLWLRDTEAAQSAERNDPYLRARIADAVAGLSEPLRDVFLMYEVHGMGHEEISEALRIPAGTSKSRLSAARDRLRELLHDVWEEQIG